jgi:hypothetical protein
MGRQGRIVMETEGLDFVRHEEDMATITSAHEYPHQIGQADIGGRVSLSQTA